MILEKYKRWPQAIIDEQGRVWRRSKTKGWFDWIEYDNRDAKGKGGYSSHSKYINHPDFVGCKKIMNKSEVPILSPA